MTHFGFVFFAINPLIDIFVVLFGWDATNKDFFIGMLSLCAPVGSFIGTILVKYIIPFGRLKALYIANAIVICGSLLTLFENVNAIAFGRFIQGIAGCGMAVVIVPKFIYETAPIHYRGKLGALSQFNLALGNVLGQAIGFGTPTDYDS